MMGPVLRNLDKKKAVLIKELLCRQNKTFYSRTKGEGGSLEDRNLLIIHDQK